jgi:hypothetical protein
VRRADVPTCDGVFGFRDICGDSEQDAWRGLHLLCVGGCDCHYMPAERAVMVRSKRTGDVATDLGHRYINARA